MNIYDLINMKKDILINGYSTLEESYECIESSPEEEYLNTICENFDLSLENANLQLFHYGSEEYIYEVLEENEYWDITEEGVISAIGEGIKKIIESILNLIKKIFSFIGNLFSKILSIFDRGSSEMDEVDKAIEEFNKEIEKMAKESDKINDKFDGEIKNTTNKATDDIKKHLEDKLKKENELDDRKYNARLKAIEIKKRMAENNEKRNDIKEKNLRAKDRAEDRGYSAYNKKEMKKRLKNIRTKRAYDKRDLYGHNMNAKINPKLNGPQSLDSLYNTFGKEIKVKSGLIKIPADAEKTFNTYTNIIMDITLDLPYGIEIEKNKKSEIIKNTIIKEGGVDSIDQLRQKMILDANKTFVKNYEDTKPFDRETKINEIPLQVIKWYAYNADDLKEKIKKKDKRFDNMLKAITADIKKLEQNINNGVYEKKYNEYIENENVKNKSFDKKSIDSPEDIKKLLILFRGTLNDYTVFYKTFISNATHAYTTSIKICKMLTKQLFIKNEN